MNKVSLLPFSPHYKEYLKLVKDPSIIKYVSFTPHDSSLIFYDSEIAGFYKVTNRSDELNDREIHIAVLKKFRGLGLANYVISTLCNNIFMGDQNCKEIHLSIDKDNIASIKMAERLGFTRNLELEEELREYNDFRTLIYTIRNRNYNKNISR